MSITERCLACLSLDSLDVLPPPPDSVLRTTCGTKDSSHYIPVADDDCVDVANSM